MLAIAKAPRLHACVRAPGAKKLPCICSLRVQGDEHMDHQAPLRRCCTFTRSAHKATYPRIGSLEGKGRAKVHRAPTKRNFARMSNSLHHGTPMLVSLPDENYSGTAANNCCNSPTQK